MRRTIKVIKPAPAPPQKPLLRDVPVGTVCRISRYNSRGVLRTVEGYIFLDGTPSDMDSSLLNYHVTPLGTLDADGQLLPWVAPTPKTISTRDLKIGEAGRVVDSYYYDGAIVLRTFDGLVDLRDPQFTWESIGGTVQDMTVVPVNVTVNVEDVKVASRK